MSERIRQILGYMDAEDEMLRVDHNPDQETTEDLSLLQQFFNSQQKGRAFTLKDLEKKTGIDRTRLAYLLDTYPLQGVQRIRKEGSSLHIYESTIDPKQPFLPDEESVIPVPDLNMQNDLSMEELIRQFDLAVLGKQAREEFYDRTLMQNTPRKVHGRRPRKQKK